MKYDYSKFSEHKGRNVSSVNEWTDEQGRVFAKVFFEDNSFDVIDESEIVAVLGIETPADAPVEAETPADAPVEAETPADAPVEAETPIID